jgi:ComF family protein
MEHGADDAGWKPAADAIRLSWRTAMRRGLDLVLPPTALDDTVRTQTIGLTARAWERIGFLEEPVCDGCGAPFAHDVGLGARCVACLARPHLFDRARAACLYDDASKDLILKFKHADRPELGSLFARWLSRAAAELITDADLIMPIPLHPKRLFARRYNQAAEIARPLSRLANRRYAPDILIRRRATPSQGGKSATGRETNVAGAFVVPEHRRRFVEGRRVLLVDDVLTTGATADACTLALLRAGASAVDVAAVAVARVREAG